MKKFHAFLYWKCITRCKILENPWSMTKFRILRNSRNNWQPITYQMNTTHFTVLHRRTSRIFSNVIISSHFIFLCFLLVRHEILEVSNMQSLKEGELLSAWIHLRACPPPLVNWHLVNRTHVIRPVPSRIRSSDQIDPSEVVAHNDSQAIVSQTLPITVYRNMTFLELRASISSLFGREQQDVSFLIVVICELFVIKSQSVSQGNMIGWWSVQCAAACWPAQNTHSRTSAYGHVARLPKDPA